MAVTLPGPGRDSVTGTFGQAMTHAADALAAMSGRPIEVSAPQIRRCTAAEVLGMAGGPESVVVAVYVGITGPVEGHAFLLLAPTDARHFANLLLEDLCPVDDSPNGSLELDELQMSALQEAGNVTISAFLNEMGQHLAEAVLPTPPQVVIEMSGAILDAVLIDLAASGDRLLAGRTTFTEGGRAIDGTILVLPRPESLDVLTAALRNAL